MFLAPLEQRSRASVAVSRSIDQKKLIPNTWRCSSCSTCNWPDNEACWWSKDGKYSGGSSEHIEKEPRDLGHAVRDLEDMKAVTATK